MASKPKKTNKTVPAKRKGANGYKMPEPIPVGEVLQDINKKKWRIGPSIGVGGFGEIYSACPDGYSVKGYGNYPNVIKIEPHENGPLFVEMHFYMRNGKSEDIKVFKTKHKLKTFGMPSYIGSGSHDYKGEKYRFLVMERFGKDVWNLFLANNRQFPQHTVYRLGVQMLEVLEYIHERGYVHADVKGANILLGLTKGTENQAYLVDFGLASRYTDKEYKLDPKKAHNGTIEYTSRDAHMGVPTRRGDLEILAYNLVQWMCGSLPWEKDLKTATRVQAQKEKYMNDIPAFMKACFKEKAPGPLVSFLEYIKTIKYDAVPDYKKSKQFLEAGIKACGKQTNCNLDFKGQSTKNTRNMPSSESEEDNETDSEETPVKGKNHLTSNTLKRKSSEVPKDENVKMKKKVRRVVKKIRTPKMKKNTNTIATQTSLEKSKRLSALSSGDADISVTESVISKRTRKDYCEINDSGSDFIEDTPEKTTRKKRNELESHDEEITVHKTVKTKVTPLKTKMSYKHFPTIVNGRKPPI